MEQYDIIVQCIIKTSEREWKLSEPSDCETIDDSEK